MRAPLRDVEEEDISAHFRPATEFMQRALAGGGKLLGLPLDRRHICAMFFMHTDASHCPWLHHCRAAGPLLMC